MPETREPPFTIAFDHLQRTGVALINAVTVATEGIQPGTYRLTVDISVEADGRVVVDRFALSDDRE